MADELQDEVVNGEEWSEPVDLTLLGDDGPSTIFVGGFSAIRTAKDALQAVVYRDDRVIVLEGHYEEDLVVDSTFLDGTNIAGNGNVTFTGKLQVRYTTFDPDRELKVPKAAEGHEEAAPGEPKEGEEAVPPPEEEPEEGEEGAKKVEVIRPRALQISKMSFLGGVVVEGLARGYVDECTFGSPTGMPALEHCAQVHALSTVAFGKCAFYGSGKSTLYCFPKSKCTFDECTFAGAIKPLTNTESVRRKRGYVPPPPPPPTAPTSTECEVGIYIDDSDVAITKSVVSQVGIGLLCRDACKGTTVSESSITLTSATGILLLDKASPKISKSMVSLSGREALVLGNECHPNVRGCSFVGDVRLKAKAIHTGLTDNVIGLNKQLFVEGSSFLIKGFKVIPTDPTIVKPKKVVAAEEE